MTLTTFPFDEHLDLPRYRGQRVETYVFELHNGVTGEFLGFIHPSRDNPPVLRHNTSQSIKRQLSLNLHVADTAEVNTLTDRVLPFMLVGDTKWPLGRYMFTSASDNVSTGGVRGTRTLLDEGFIVDQVLSVSFTGAGAVNSSIIELLRGLPIIGVDIEQTPFGTVGAFAAGQTRGQAIAAYGTQGDYFPYWMAHDGMFRMIRTKDPATSIVDIDFDVGNKVVRDSPVRTNDVLTAPNRFIVVSNSSSNNGSKPVVGVYDVPPSAPHSITNRGFVIPTVLDLQLNDEAQANAVARNVGIRQTIFESVNITTKNDPRHDSFNVIHWSGENWLELEWEMELTPGGNMTHLLRKAYV